MAATTHKLRERCAADREAGQHHCAVHSGQQGRGEARAAQRVVNEEEQCRRLQWLRFAQLTRPRAQRSDSRSVSL